VAVASFDPNYFADYYRQIDLGSQSLTTLVGLDGYPRMLRVGDEMHLKAAAPPLVLPDVIRHERAGSFVSDQLYDRVKRLYVFEHLDQLPLVVVVGMRESEVFSEYTRLEHSWLMSSSVLTGLIVLFVGIAIYYIQRAEKINVELRTSYENLDAAKQLELDMSNRLTQSEKLAALGQLAAGVAHEINNPMGFVSSNISTLRKYANALEQAMQATRQLQQGEISSTQLQAVEKKLNIDFVMADLPIMLNETEEGVSRVKQIVSDLKNFARADSQREWVVSDLRAGILSTLNIVNHEVKYRADVKVNLDELPPIECIPSQLNQVFLNLIVNAAQAMPKDRRGTIELRSSVQDQHVCIEVIDDGDGMSAQTLKRIFEPFYTTKKTGEGTGLGLSVSLGIVQRHHGSLTVQTEEGKGTCFKLVLPIRQQSTLT
jgi:signal transduction histidine kinase